MLVIDAPKLGDFEAIARRERCPFAVIGEIDATGILVLEDRKNGARPVNMPLDVLLGKAPKMLRDVRRVTPQQAPLALADIDLRDAAYRLLRFPAVADKTFLISIGDRTVGGMIMPRPDGGSVAGAGRGRRRDPRDYFGHRGEAMAMGERTPVAVLDAPASGRLAVGEALTNILAADIGELRHVHAVGELDGGLRRAWRRRGAVRHGSRCGRGTVSRTEHRHPGGQGLVVHENRMGRRRGAQIRGGAGVVDSFRIRASRRCASHLDAAAAHRSRGDDPGAHRPGRGRESPRRIVAGAGARCAGRDAARSR